MARIPPSPTPRVTKTLSQDNSPLSPRPRHQFEQPFKLHGWVQTARPASIKLLSYPQDVLPFVALSPRNLSTKMTSPLALAQSPLQLFPCHSPALLTQEQRLTFSSESHLAKCKD